MDVQMETELRDIREIPLKNSRNSITESAIATVNRLRPKPGQIPVAAFQSSI